MNSLKLPKVSMVSFLHESQCFLQHWDYLQSLWLNTYKETFIYHHNRLKKETLSLGEAPTYQSSDMWDMKEPGSSAGKEFTCNAGDPSLIPGQRSLVGATEQLSTKLKQWSSGESVLLTAKHFNMGSPHSVSFHPSLMGWVWSVFYRGKSQVPKKLGHLTNHTAGKWLNPG